MSRPPRRPGRKYPRTPIFDHPVSAIPVVAEIAGVDERRAFEILQALAKAGFAIAPFNPSDGMLDAYVAALGKPSKHHSVIINNLGKARRRWQAMATVGTRMALSRQPERQETDLEPSD